MNCDENFNANPRHNEIDAVPVLSAFTNYLDGPVEDVEKKLSNNFLMCSIDNNNWTNVLTHTNRTKSHAIFFCVKNSSYQLGTRKSVIILKGNDHDNEIYAVNIL